MRTNEKERYEVLRRLDRIGIGYEDAHTLRRIAATLHRWFEQECGDGNAYGSWAIERDEETGIPYFIHHHHYRHGLQKDRVYKRKIADKETGARKRLAVLIERYPNLSYYVQTDPRGASVYILTKEQGGDAAIDSMYNQGIAVY